MEIGDASMKKKKYNWVKKVKLQHKIEHPCACGETVKLSLKSRAHECNCGIVWTYAPTMDEKKSTATLLCYCGDAMLRACDRIELCSCAITLNAYGSIVVA